MIEFNKIAVELPGFKYPVVYVKELSVRQIREIQSMKFNDDIEMFLKSLSYCLVNEQGDKVITADYTVDHFSDDLPQRFITKLSTAFASLNSDDEDTAVEIAKNS